MSLWTLILIALGLSADAFAVAVGKGLSMPNLSRRGALMIAVAFGAFQGLMPVLGWLLGSGLEGYITTVDHWIAFGLLAAVGARMLHDARQPHDEAQAEAPVVAGNGMPTRSPVPSGPRSRTHVSARELLALALATSIDALAVGIGFAFLDVKILPAAGLIAVITFGLAVVGVRLGRAAGARWQAAAEAVGGLVLILIGLKILLDHLHVL